MNNTKILSGKFATGDGQLGNFTGYNAKGQRIFVHKAQMDSIGMTDDKSFKPFFAIIGEREIATRDANGDLTDVMVVRTQALSVFKTQEDLIDATNADAKLTIAAASDLKSAASSSGLSDAAIDALLTASI